MTQKNPPPSLTVTVEELVASVQGPAWDLLLLGDGSGQGWDKPAGWAVVGIDRLSQSRFALMGGCSRGTVNWAESDCYLRGLAYDFHHLHGGKLLQHRRVLIVSDSQFTVNVGNGEARSRANSEVWAGFQHLHDEGYRLTWRWNPRNNNPLAVELDICSRQGDVMESGVDWLQHNLYDLLPFGGMKPAQPQTSPDAR